MMCHWICNRGAGGARWASAVALALATALAGCTPKKAPEQKGAGGAPEAKAVLVEVAEVRLGKIEEILERSAPLQAEAQVSVLARTSNPAVELLVEEGDKVEAGEVLLRLEDFRQQTAHNQAMTQYEEARGEYERQESLHRQNLISLSAFQNAEFSYNRAKLQLENAKRELEYTEVLAPIAGTVTSRTVKVGDQVGMGTPIFEIIDLDSTVAVVHVPEQYLPKLRPGMEARLSSGTLGGRVFAGYVKRISPIVEARAGTIKVVVGVRELGPLRPGMWVEVELVLDSKEEAVLIPKRAIVYDNDQTFAFKVQADTNGVARAKRELVVALNADKEHIEPRGRFEAGERIVVAGHSGLKDGAPIRELAAAAPEPGKTNAAPAGEPAASGAK